MSAPWFDGNAWGWLPGTLLGVTVGTLGGLTGWLAPRGQGRAFVLGGMGTMLGLSVVLLVLGVYAWFDGQPYGVWYGLGLAGLIGTLVTAPNLRMIRRQYRAAEERKMSARDAGL